MQPYRPPHLRRRAEPPIAKKQGEETRTTSNAISEGRRIYVGMSQLFIRPEYAMTNAKATCLISQRRPTLGHSSKGGPCSYFISHILPFSFLPIKRAHLHLHRPFHWQEPVLCFRRPHHARRRSTCHRRIGRERNARPSDTHQTRRSPSARAQWPLSS
jgi:hypothetical protein